jgi:hypothetical protein
MRELRQAVIQLALDQIAETEQPGTEGADNEEPRDDMDHAPAFQSQSVALQSSATRHGGGMAGAGECIGQAGSMIAGGTAAAADSSAPAGGDPAELDDYPDLSMVAPAIENHDMHDDELDDMLMAA